MSRYETAIDLGDPHDSRTQLITLVGLDKRVLDVGCGDGETARALAGRGCQVSGVDAAPAADGARDALDEVVVADLDRTPLTEHFKADSFDAVVLGDVLGHLRDPAALLQDVRTLLRPSGRVVVSVPNAAHGAVRLGLLRGRWDPTDGRVRFFTLDALCALLEEAGLVVEVLRSVVLDPMEVPEIAVDDGHFPPALVEWVRDQPGALDHEYVAAARVLDPDEVRPPRPHLEPVVAYDLARRRDHHTARMLEEIEEQHRRLTRRDHVIGLEATVVAEQQRTSLLRARAEHLERRVRRLAGELDDLVDVLDRIAGSRRPRPALRDLVQDLRARSARRAQTDKGDG